jgi:hypothetical protein
MIKQINQIDIYSLGLIAGDEPNFTLTADLGLVRVTGEIMLYSEKDKIFMGDFYAKNLISNKEYFSYWLKMPDEVFSDINYMRGKNYDIASSNSPIAFILKVNLTDKFHNKKFVYNIDLLNTLDR